MSPKLEAVKTLCTWNNGQKAVVHLVEDSKGEKRIQKIYKPGFTKWMFREYLSLRYVSRRLPIVPKLMSFHPFKKEISMSYIYGQRVLEWVLQHFGDSCLDLDEFLNFEEMGTDVRILEAFQRFRNSTAKSAVDLRNAIRASYDRLHDLGWQHGTSDPRNVIYDEHQVYIIDLDHARPSFSPAEADFPSLNQWFGVTRNCSKN